MVSQKRILGFDRKINLDWLDATLHLVGQELSADDIRSRLDSLLEGQVSGTSHNSARGKTKTVLMHIWVNVPDKLVDFRNRAIVLSKLYGADKRVTLHWGMCLVTYPFFFDLALNIGRLLNMQEEISLLQLQRRMAENWSERSTLTRAVQRVIRNMVDWNILRETKQRGHYQLAPRIILNNHDDLETWLIEAFMLASDSEVRPFKTIIANPVFFPFQFALSSSEFEKNSNFEIVRQGLDEELVIVR